MATALVTGAPGAVVQLLAADAGRVEIYGINESGAEVDLFLESEALPFDQVSGSAPNHRFDITGLAAQLKLDARCRTAPLQVRVTDI